MQFTAIFPFICCSSNKTFGNSRFMWYIQKTSKKINFKTLYAVATGHLPGYSFSCPLLWRYRLGGPTIRRINYILRYLFLTELIYYRLIYLQNWQLLISNPFYSDLLASPRLWFKSSFHIYELNHGLERMKEDYDTHVWSMTSYWKWKLNDKRKITGKKTLTLVFACFSFP